MDELELLKEWMKFYKLHIGTPAIEIFKRWAQIRIKELEVKKNGGT